MEEYILHELHGDNPDEITQDAEPHMNEPLEEAETGPIDELEEVAQLEYEPITSQMHNQELEFVPIEEPGPNWEMELAQAYVRAQPLDGVFRPEEGLRMGTAFPNLSQPYGGRE